MELRWCHKGQPQPRVAGQCDKAIVVFGGWAVGADVFAHLTGPYDILFVSDYRDLEAELPDLSAYSQICLLAWSFGVAAYAHWQQGRPDPFARKVAVNGTLTPINRATGVPPVAMDRTMKTLGQDTYQVFLTRVFNARQPKSVIDVAARKDELLAIQTRGDAPHMPFDRVWISAADKIFPPANQARAWPSDQVRSVQAAHAPFDQFETWQQVLA